MAAVVFTERALKNVKRALQRCYVDSTSAHLTEALAAGLGFRTHAALLVALAATDERHPEIRILDDESFSRRLSALTGGAELGPEDFDVFELLPYDDIEHVIRTRSRTWYELEYKGTRAKAWRNLMVATVNAGIQQKIFSVRPGDNRWPTTPDGRGTAVFRFDVEGIPAIGSVSDAGYDELNVHGALWPTGDAERLIAAHGANFHVGQAVAYGWLERREGAWIEYNGSPELHCRKALVNRVAAIDVVPLCFGDRGDFKM